MKRKLTAAIERRVLELRNIRDHLEPELHLVSRDALREWTAMQASWPSDDQLREGVSVLTEEELEAIEAKVRRFSDVIHRLSPKITAARTTRSIHEEAPTQGRLSAHEARSVPGLSRPEPTSLRGRLDSDGSSSQTIGTSSPAE